MLERFKKCITFISWKPCMYIFACLIVSLSILFGCQGLMNVNGEDNQVIVADSFKGGNK